MESLQTARYLAGDSPPRAFHGGSTSFGGACLTGNSSRGLFPPMRLESTGVQKHDTNRLLGLLRLAAWDRMPAL